MSSPSSEFVDQLTSMRMNVQGGHFSPHKAVMVLAVIEMVASGDATENHICYGPELLEHFQRYFGVVKTDTDSCTPLNPFWHLKSEPFWHHKVRQGQESVYKTMGRPRGPNVMGEVVEHAYLDDELFECLKCPGTRMEILDQLIRRYFPTHRDMLLEMAESEEEIGIYARALREQAPERPVVKETARDTAFARVVKQAYHYQCAACGLRVLHGGIHIVDAAHLIPFAVSYDDDPCNGICLCKNHHWLMDKEIIFPVSGNIWRVTPALDDRIEGHRAVLDLESKEILLPSEAKYNPRRDALQWREQVLRGNIKPSLV